MREKSVERPVAMEVVEPPQTQLDSYVQEETVTEARSSRFRIFTVIEHVRFLQYVR